MSSWMMTPILLVVVLGLWPIFYLLRSMREKGKENRPTSVGIHGSSMPPGPQGLPILGSLLMLGDPPHRKLHQLAMEYGPIMFMKLGLVPTIVVSSPQAAQQFLKTHDLVFASRPISEASYYITYSRKGMAFIQYGPYWRNMRKLCTLELLSNIKIESFWSMRREELGHLVQSLKDSAAARHPADLTINVSSLITNMTSRMVFGKKYMGESFNERGFKEAVEELMYLVGAFNIADYIPCLGPFDLQGLRRRMKANNEFFDSLFEKIIDEHLQARDEKYQKDFVDFMLEFVASSNNELFDRISIKAIMLEMLVVAVDTTSTTIDWALSEIMKHPRVMKKAQEELEAVVGMERAVEESDLAKLEYLDMIVKETMRIHPVVPLLVPHEAMEDCTINNFYIPKKSRVIINAWAIGRDPDVWSNPEEFFPERFVGTSIDVRGRDFQLIPFGSGRRSCPGMQLGITVVRLVLAQLLHCFDWELPNGMSPDELDMTENFSIVTPRASHLCAIPACRLRNDISV